MAQPQIQIAQLGNDVLSTRYVYVDGEGADLPCYVHAHDEGHYCLDIDGQLQVVAKAQMDTLYEDALDEATGGVETPTVIYNDFVSSAQLEAEAMADDVVNTIVDVISDIPEVSPAASDLILAALNNEISLTGNATEAFTIPTITLAMPAPEVPPLVLESVADRELTETATRSSQEATMSPLDPNAPLQDRTPLSDPSAETRLAQVEEELAEMRRVFHTPDTIYTIERMVDALHDSVLHDSHLLMDRIRGMVATMLKYYLTIPAVVKDGQVVNDMLNINGRYIRPEDVPNLSRMTLFDVMSRLMVDYHHMRSSHLRLDRQHEADQIRIKAQSEDANKRERQIASLEREIQMLRENREGLTAGEAAEVFDYANEEGRRASALAARIGQYSEPEDAYVLYLRTQTGGVYLAFEKDSKSVRFETSIATTPRAGVKMLLSRNEVETSLPRLIDWIDKSLLTPEAKQLGISRQEGGYKIIPMRVVYRNTREITINLKDGKVDVDFATEIGTSPMPVKDVQVYLQPHSMAGMTLTKFKATQRQRQELANAISQQVTGGSTFTPTHSKQTVFTDPNELVDDLLDDDVSTKSVPVASMRRGTRVELPTATAATPSAVETETDETEATTRRPAATKSSVLARLQSRMEGIRAMRKSAAAQVEEVTEDEAEAEVELTETAEEAPAPAPRRSRAAPVVAKAPAKKLRIPAKSAKTGPAKAGAKRRR